MPRPKTIGRCVTKRCKGRWQLTPRNKRQQFCYTCARARKRVRDREIAAKGRFVRRIEARERAELVRELANDYEATGHLDPYQHGEAPYSAKEWSAILTEAKALGEAMIADDEYQDQMAVLRNQDAAQKAADVAEKLARLKEALKVVVETKDALGERVVKERIAALVWA